MPVQPLRSDKRTFASSKRIPLLFILLLISSISFSIFASPVFAAIINVTDNYPTIQAAVNAANSGDTVNVAAGTYDEQVVITKPLTLQGAGDTTIVKPSSAAVLTTILDGYYAPGYKQVAGVIVVNETANVVIKNLKVDGALVTTNPTGADWNAGGGVVTGIFYREASGVIDTVTVTGMLVGSTGTNVRGYGAYLSAVTNFVSVEIKNSGITNYDKNGINAHGDRLDAYIHHNTITGRGPLPGGDEVQNGVLIADGASGTVDNNIISDMSYMPLEWWCTGILFYNAGGSADDNIINDVQSGIIVQDGTFSAEDNTINGGTVGIIGLWAQYVTGGAWTVSFVDNSVSVAKDAWGSGLLPADKYQNAAIGAQTWNAGTSLTVTMDGNQLVSASPTDADGIMIGDNPAWAAGSITATITDNVISEWDHGVRLVSSVTNVNISSNKIKNNVGTSSGIHLETGIDATKVHANFNKISGNLNYGVYNGGTGTLDAENNWWGSNTGPSGVGPGTGDAVSTNVDYTPWLQLNLDLTSPKNGEKYNFTRIWINATTSILADKIEYSLDGGSYRKLCNDCDEYKAKKTFSDGSHTLTVKATLNGETDSDTVSFFVDSDEPDIKKTLPEDGEVLRGTEFYVKYTESDLQSVKLYWKESIAATYTPVTLSLSDCLSGTNKECKTNVDLNSYDGKYINYYFELKDKANIVVSSVKTIKIDNTNPSVTIVSPAPEDKIYADTRIYLTANVGVGDVVERLEYSIDGGSWRRLCSDCNGYSSRKTFSYGDHTLVVRATDYAGNVGEATRHFSVDNKEPKILNQYPTNKKYTNGTFTVVYTEENLLSVSLFWRPLSGAYTEVPLSWCLPGKNRECSVFVDLSAYNGQVINYYFVVRNHVSETACDEYKETVDVVVPNIVVNSPTLPTYTSRRIEFDIAVTEVTLPEKVKLEYSDNGESFRTLCTNCDSYHGTRSFSKDVHNLLIKATDKAGNVDTEIRAFTIV